MNKLQVVLHDGVFHADDVFSCAIIKLIHPDIEILRSRDDDIIKQADFRIDVGGKNNPDSNDFDHHMTDGAGERENGIPYASCGLVWKTHGLKLAKTKYRWEYIDRRIIQSIDAIDCGYSPEAQKPEIQHYTVSEMIDSYNPVWFETDVTHDESFSLAVKTAMLILQNELKRAEGFEMAKSIIYEAIETAVNPHYIVFDQYCPWQHIVINETDILYVIFPSTTGDWRVRAVPTFSGSFESRKPLPKSWAGKRTDELAEITGVDDATFCHPARFIAGSKTKEGALQLVELALS
jgi:uncharacterized UPF0160 family protein